MKLDEIFEKKGKAPELGNEETAGNDAEAQAPTVDDDVSDDEQDDSQAQEEQGHSGEPSDDAGLDESGKDQEEGQADEESKIEQLNKFAISLGYENIDEFMRGDAADRIKNFSEIEKEYKRLSAENEELYNTYENVKSPFADERLSKLNKIMNDNPDMSLSVASKIVSGDIDNMNNVDIVMLKEKMENPEMPDRLIKKSLERKYNIDDWSDLDDDAKDYIEVDALKAKKALSKYSNVEADGAILPDNIKDRIAQKQQEANVSIEEIEKQWDEPLSGFDEAFKQVPIPRLKKDGGKENIESYANYVLSDNDKAEMKRRVRDIIRSNKLKLTKENINIVNDRVVRDITFERLPKIINIAVDKAVNDYKESEQKRKYNPSKPKGEKVDKAKKSGKRSIMDL